MMKDRSGGIRRRSGLGFWLARRARARAAHALGLGKTDYGRGDSAFIGAGRGADAQARGPRGSIGLEFDTEPEEEDEVWAPAVGGTQRKQAAAAAGASGLGWPVAQEGGGRRLAACAAACWARGQAEWARSQAERKFPFSFYFPSF